LGDAPLTATRGTGYFRGIVWHRSFCTAHACASRWELCRV